MLKIKQDTVVRLPVEYQEVKYIESTGTQYIDTGIPLNQYRKCEIQFLVTSIGTSKCIDGGTNGSINNNLNYYAEGSSISSMLSLAYGKTGNQLHSMPININSKYDVIYKMLSNSCYLSINGNEYNTETGVTLITNGNNVFLFGESNSASGQEPYTNLVSMRLYNAKYYNDNDILIRNFIPCYRKSDNKAGLYDLINNQFYVNAGTGVFTIGEIVGKDDINLIPILGSKQITKTYLGTVLKYSGPIRFNQSLFPVEWDNKVTNGSQTTASATNKYGNWNIKATSSVYPVWNAFDNDETTYYHSSPLYSYITYNIFIECPILICPKKIYLSVQRIGKVIVSRFK